MNKNAVFPVGFICAAVALLPGCAPMVPVDPMPAPLVTTLPVPDPKGVYHKVGPGETIWRIAKTYGISIDDVIRANSIPNAAQVERNQLLFIPGADRVRTVMLDEGKSEKDFIWPVRGKVVRYYGSTRSGHVNKGIDIAVKQGTKIRAARSGRVVFADYLTGYGYTVILDHEDGFHSVYAFNGKIDVVLGEYVVKNAEISRTGEINGLARLHFQIRKESMEDNPLYYLP